MTGSENRSLLNGELLVAVVLVAAVLVAVLGTSLWEPGPNSASCRLGPDADAYVPGREMSVNGMLSDSAPIQAVVGATPVVVPPGTPTMPLSMTRSCSCSTSILTTCVRFL